MGFCGSCGSEMQDGAAFCGKCGAKTANAAAQVNGGVSPSPENTNTNITNNGGKNSNKTIGMIVVGVVALVVLILAVKLIGSIVTPGYKKPIHNIVTGFNKSDSRTLFKAFPDVITKEMEKSDYKDFDESLKDGKDDLKDDYGKNVKMSYKIIDKEKLDKDEISDLQDDIKDMLGKRMKIKQAYELDVELKIKGKDDSDEEETTITVIKVGSKWYINPMDFYQLGLGLMGF